MKIVVLAGGLSTERQVSLTSGTGVCRAPAGAGPPGHPGGYVPGAGGLQRQPVGYLRRAGRPVRRQPGPLHRAGPGGRAPQSPGSGPFHAGQGRSDGVRHGRPGVPGPARRLRRGRTDSGHPGPAGRALYRQRLSGQRHGHGQVRHQAHHGTPPGCPPPPGTTCAIPGRTFPVWLRSCRCPAP